MFAWLLANPKDMIIVALVALILGCGLFIGIQKIEIAHKTATIEQQKGTIDSLTRANEIMNQNAIAARQAQADMQKVVTAAVGLKTIIKDIPDQVKKGLKNETMERVNHCLGEFFRDGVLAADCSAGGTVLPKAISAGVDRGSGKSP
jgi:hypothetical protein